MDDNIFSMLINQKNSANLFNQITNGLEENYQGKNTIIEFAKSKEETVHKIKDDIYYLLYGKNYIDSKNNKQLKNIPKSIFKIIFIF